MAFGIGLGCGSYATMPYYRLPNKIPCAGKWVGEKSACPSCGVQLRTRDLIPVFNWLGTGGKCFGCGAKINPVYFFIEFTITLLSVIIYLKFGFDNLNWYMFLLVPAICLVIMTATDFTYNMIPDALLVVMVLGAFMVHTPDDFYYMAEGLVVAVLGGLVYSKLYEKIKGEEYKRWDYIKLVAVCALWFKIKYFALFMAIAIGGVVLLQLVKATSGREKFIPPAAAFAIAFLYVALFSNVFSV